MYAAGAATPTPPAARMFRRGTRGQTSTYLPHSRHSRHDQARVVARNRSSMHVRPMGSPLSLRLRALSCFVSLLFLVPSGAALPAPRTSTVDALFSAERVLDYAKVRQLARTLTADDFSPLLTAALTRASIVLDLPIKTLAPAIPQHAFSFSRFYRALRNGLGPRALPLLDTLSPRWKLAGRLYYAFYLGDLASLDPVLRCTPLPRDSYIALHCLALYVHTAQYSEALSLGRRLLTTISRDDVLTADRIISFYVTALAALGHLNNALKTLDQHIRRFGLSPELALHKASLLVLRDSPRHALIYLSAIERLHPRFREAFALDKANLLLALGEHRKAESELRQALARRSLDFNSLSRVGLLALRLESFDLVEEVLLRAQAVGKGRHSYLRYLVFSTELARRQGLHFSAINHAAAALRLHPFDHEALDTALLACPATKAPLRCFGCLLHWRVTLTPFDTETIRLLEQYYYKAGNPARAAQLHQLLLQCLSGTTGTSGSRSPKCPPRKVLHEKILRLRPAPPCDAPSGCLYLRPPFAAGSAAHAAPSEKEGFR